jgi:hypothetical protein
MCLSDLKQDEKQATHDSVQMAKSFAARWENLESARKICRNVHTREIHRR